MEFKKYDKIYRMGNKNVDGIFSNPEDTIYLQEKIDGSCVRFMIRNGKVIFGSHNQQLTSDLGEDTNVDKFFRRCLDYIGGKISCATLTPDVEQYVFFGEACIKHSINYDWEHMPPFLGFDVYNITDKVYLIQDIAKTLFRELGLEFVPCFGAVKVKDLKPFTDKDVPKSSYYSGQSEGIVIKNYSRQQMTKYVTDKFKEVNKDTFGANKKFANDDTEVLVAKYCTNPRIDKMVFKLVESGKELDLPLMKELPTGVYKDIMMEEGSDILFSKLSVDFNKFKKMVSKRCLNVLKTIMVNNALSGDKK